jgi:hypothetical protein
VKLRILLVLAGLAVALGAPGLARAADDPTATPPPSTATGMADGNGCATDGMADGNGGATLGVDDGVSDGNGGADQGDGSTAGDVSTVSTSDSAPPPAPTTDFGMSDGNG